MPQPPIIDAAEGQDVGTIWLSWHSDAPGIQKFWIARKKRYPWSSLPVTFSTLGASGSFYDTTDLEPFREYQYRVGAQFSDGSIDWSLPKYGRTLGFEPTFVENPAFIGNSVGWEGYTLVQRIEAAALMPISRQQVKRVVIYLYASDVAAASIDRVFISRPDPALGAKLYDSDPDDLTEVPLPRTPFVVDAGVDNGVALRPVDYIVRPQSQALLIAVDFTARGTASEVRRSDAPPERAVAYWFQYDPSPPGQPVPPEAGLASRSAGYTPAQRVYLIGRVLIG